VTLLRSAVFDVGRAVEDQLDPFALQHELGSGKAALPCETRVDRARQSVLSTGVWAVPVPTIDSASSRPGDVEDGVAAGFLQRSQARGMVLGNSIFDLPMFAWPRAALTVIVRRYLRSGSRSIRCSLRASG